MIKSMTGFGRGEYSDGKRNVVIEIRAVNNRYNEITFRLSRRYTFAEERLKALVKKTVLRGKADISVLVDYLTVDDSKVRLNIPVAVQYYNNLMELKKSFDLKGDIDINLLAGFPEVMKQIPDIEDEEEVLKTFETALQKAIHGFETMRITEREKMGDDIRNRGAVIARHLQEIESIGPDITAAYYDKLKDRIRDLIAKEAELPEDRIALEAAIFADKINVTEEIVRLKSHLSQLSAILSGTDASNGKKLDFLVQELNREVNTIGSKANDVRITNNVLEMKSEIEKIREQIQNIE
jgi:uncharacterized protein (TIGR00255 family)